MDKNVVRPTFNAQGDEGRGHVHASHAGPQAEGDHTNFSFRTFSGIRFFW